jgi:hypothetical protein
MPLDPKAAREWTRIARDIVILFVAAFMLIYETIVVQSPNLYVLGAGLTLLGIPPALRLDSIIGPADRGGRE